MTALGNDQPLGNRHRDHALTGDWPDCRDCHVKPDLVLIYRKPDANVLQLVRPVESRPSCTAKVVALPRAGGLHHRYEWREAA